MPISITMPWFKLVFRALPRACLQSRLLLSLPLSQDGGPTTGRHGFNLGSTYIGAGNFDSAPPFLRPNLAVPFVCAALWWHREASFPSQNRNLQKFNLESAPSDTKNREAKAQTSPMWLGRAQSAPGWSDPTWGSVRQVPGGLSWSKAGNKWYWTKQKIEERCSFFFSWIMISANVTENNVIFAEHISQLGKVIRMWLQAALFTPL